MIYIEMLFQILFETIYCIVVTGPKKSDRPGPAGLKKSVDRQKPADV
jgi:hypothetical protein